MNLHTGTQFVDGQSGRVLMGSRSTPNSPRLLPKRARQPPAIPQRPNAAFIANPALVALEKDAPWPNFNASNEHIDGHASNNTYHQSLPPEV